MAPQVPQVSGVFSLLEKIPGKASTKRCAPGTLGRLAHLAGQTLLKPPIVVASGSLGVRPLSSPGFASSLGVRPLSSPSAEPGCVKSPVEVFCQAKGPGPGLEPLERYYAYRSHNMVCGRNRDRLIVKARCMHTPTNNGADIAIDLYYLSAYADMSTASEMPSVTYIVLSAVVEHLSFQDAISVYLGFKACSDPMT
eukprot:3587579-Pyramimonas_sp.AAC.1